MTRRAFRRINALGLLGGGVVLVLAVALLVLATGDAWRKQQPVADVKAPAQTTPHPTSSPTPVPIVTPTSVWTAKAGHIALPSATASPVALVPQVVDHRAAVRAARVRVMHAAASLGAIRIFVNGAPIGQSLSFPAISPYIKVPVGQLRIEGRAVADGKRVWATLLVVAVGQDFSVAVAQAANDVQVVQLLDDNTLPGYGEMRLRIVNLSNRQAWLDAKSLSPIRRAIGMPTLGSASTYATLAVQSGAPFIQLGPVRFGALYWTMGTVYTVWVISGKSSKTVRAVSEDAHLDYPLLPETGLEEEVFKSRNSEYIK